MSAEESGKSAELRFTRDMFRAAVFDDIGSEDIGYTNYSYWRSTIRTFFKSMVVRVMVVIVIAIILMSFIYPILSKTDPRALTTNTAEWNLRPSADHWFGTDTIGRDIWARAWYGTRNSFLLAFVIACSDIGLGAIMGALWGYSKKADVVMVEVYNVITNVPSTVYLVLLAYIMGTSYLTLFISMASRGWIVEARIFRNRILSIRDNEYNIASKCLGTPVRRIATKNIIPHIISLIIMETALCVPYSISSEVFLSLSELECR